MAKSLKEILAGSKASKKEKLKLGEKPGVDYAPKAKGEEEFVAKHEIEKFSDRVGNGDEAYKATTVKHAQTEKDPHGHKSRKDEKVNEDSLEDGNYLAEGTVVSHKVVMNQRGGEDHYEMHHHGTGSTGWHSIIKTHQDGRSLMNDSGGYNAVHIGSEKYVAKKWKGITHQKLLPNDHPMRKNWRETPDAAPAGKLSAVKEETQHKVGDKVAIDRGGSQILGTVSKIDPKFTHVRSGNMTHEVGHHMVKLREEDLNERDTQKKEETVLVTNKADKKSTKTGGGVKRIKKSEYDEKKHSLAENKSVLKDYLRSIANRAMHIVLETQEKDIDDSIIEVIEDIKENLDVANDLMLDEALLDKFKKAVKNVKRGLKGWDKSGGTSPKDISNRVKASDDDSLNHIVKRTGVGAHSPADLQQKLAKREINKRNQVK